MGSVDLKFSTNPIMWYLNWDEFKWFKKLLNSLQQDSPLNPSYTSRCYGIMYDAFFFICSSYKILNGGQLTLNKKSLIFRISWLDDEIIYRLTIERVNTDGWELPIWESREKQYIIM